MVDGRLEGVAGEPGQPRLIAAAIRSAPGLYFTGYTNPISGMFRELRIDAERIARAISRG